MKQSPDIFWKFTSGLIFATADALFFLMFTMAYNPFGMDSVFGMGRGLSEFNTLMLSCIIYGTILILHTVLYFLRNKISHSWWAYIGWWTMELFVASAYMAMYLELMDKTDPGYFHYLALSLKYTFSITVYPHTVLNLVFVIIAFAQLSDKSQASSGLIKFHDSARQLKFSVEKSSLLYINAEENYIRIHYLDGDVAKEYLLRSSMNSVEDLMSKAGLIRCHRSYFVNPIHVRAVRRESNGVITAEIKNVSGTVPVSKKKYEELSDRI